MTCQYWWIVVVSIVDFETAGLLSTTRQWIARLEENDLRIIRINLPGYSDSYSNDATVFLYQLRGGYHSELPAMRQDLLSYFS